MTWVYAKNDKKQADLISLLKTTLSYWERILGANQIISDTLGGIC